MRLTGSAAGRTVRLRPGNQPDLQQMELLYSGDPPPEALIQLVDHPAAGVNLWVHAALGWLRNGPVEISRSI